MEHIAGRAFKKHRAKQRNIESLEMIKQMKIESNERICCASLYAIPPHLSVHRVRDWVSSLSPPVFLSVDIVDVAVSNEIFVEQC